MSRWFTHIPPEEFEIYGSAGFAQKRQPGKVPALLVIDCTLAFTGSRDKESLTAAIQEYRTACGPPAWEALKFIKEAITLFRKQNRLVLFSKPNLRDGKFAGRATKATGPLEKEEGNRIPDEIAPLASEWVIEKTRASCFFGTPFASYLNQKRVDTLVIVGTTTSGCVRATVVDAFSHGFTVFLIEEGCFDRSHFAHVANLFDMNAKYADVITFEEFKAMFS